MLGAILNLIQTFSKPLGVKKNYISYKIMKHLSLIEKYKQCQL